MKPKKTQFRVDWDLRLSFLVVTFVNNTFYGAPIIFLIQRSHNVHITSSFRPDHLRWTASLVPFRTFIPNYLFNRRILVYMDHFEFTIKRVLQGWIGISVVVLNTAIILAFGEIPRSKPKVIPLG